MRPNMNANRFFPSSLFARMALILLAGMLAAQLVSVWLQWGERATVVSQARGQNFADRMAEAIRMLEANDSTQRNLALSALQSRELSISLINEDQVSPVVPRGQIQATIAARLGSEHEIRSVGGGMGMQHGGGGMQRGGPMRNFDVRLHDGQWVRITSLQNNDTPALPNDLIVNVVIMLVVITSMVMVAVGFATRPLQQLARAADVLGRDLDAPPMREEGPTEMRRAVQAFNHMQAQIKRLVDERARALAAVSHDLRTPLTRLRLRAELVDDGNLRDQIANDLDAMASMIDSTLDYLRGLRDSEMARPIDMNALLESLAQDAAVLGKSVSIDGQATSPYSGRLSALRRALQNLIDNAIEYGHCAHLRIVDDRSVLRIIVEDEGPGIRPEELGRIGEPYYRPDTSRSRETGGVGLGLSIVKDIARVHGGELLLANRPLGGFMATLDLPRKQKFN